MDKIKNINSIFEAARSQVSNQLKSGKLKGNKQNSRKKSAAPTGLKDNLKLIITQKLKSLDPDGENYYDLACNAFFESVIINEFGDEIINSPEFNNLIGKLSEAFKNNPASSEKMTILIDSLTKS